MNGKSLWIGLVLAVASLCAADHAAAQLAARDRMAIKKAGIKPAILKSVSLAEMQNLQVQTQIPNARVQVTMMDQLRAIPVTDRASALARLNKVFGLPRTTDNGLTVQDAMIQPIPNLTWHRKDSVPNSQAFSTHDLTWKASDTSAIVSYCGGFVSSDGVRSVALVVELTCATTGCMTNAWVKHANTVQSDPPTISQRSSLSIGVQVLGGSQADATTLFNLVNEAYTWLQTHES